MKKVPLKTAILVILIFLAIAGPTDTKKAFGQQPLGSRAELDALAPILGNYADGSVALSNNITIAPDAAPTNTTGINVSTSTNFKGRLEGYPATGVVRVTDAHPAGMYTVTVRAFDSGGASATKTFTLTVTTPMTCNPVTFAAPVFYDAGAHPNSVAVGDFNGDGKQDLAVANGNSNNVSILLGDGTGNFGVATNFNAGASPYSVAVGDFNGDGKQDLAVANNSSSNVSILLGDGTGNFGVATNFAAGTHPYSVAVGDFNGDGNQDLAVANFSSNNVSILLGNGAGSFSGPTNFVASSGPISVAVGDFNGDGNQDLAVANNSSSNVSILLSNGAGSFSAPANFVAGANPFSVAMGDFNGDGNQDLAVAPNVSILLGNGAGSFSFPPTNFVAGMLPFSVAVGDFNGDGNQDLAVANQNSNNVSILLGNGAGSFSAPTNFVAGTLPTSVAVGDFNGDGKQDLAVTNIYPGRVAILLRNCAPTPTPTPPPTLTGAVSRKTHGAGTFDINLPLTGTPGIECRTTGATNDYTIVVNFSGAVTVSGTPQAQVTSGMGTIGSGGVSNGGMVTISGSTVTIPLTNVTNAQTINVTLYGVNGGIGDVVIPMSVLAGDVNGNGAVNASDVALVKARLGQPVNATNFRADVNASGSINGTDISIVKSNIGSGVP